MKAYVVRQYIKSLDEIPSLLVDAPEPAVAEGEVLIEVCASGLNFFDVLQMQGKYQTQPAFPWTAGFEFAGRVLTSARGSPYQIGARVFGAAQGAFAERIAVRWQELLPVPENMTYEEACGLYVTYPTSYAALVYRANVKRGETVLVHAAAGGVGIAACQIAKALGAVVIATAGSAEKLSVAQREGGADFGVNYTENGWEKQVKKLTGGKGVDVVYDPVGMVNKSLKCIAWNGRIVVVGFAAGTIESVKTNQVLLKNCAVTGVFWGAYSKNEPEKVKETWDALLAMFAKDQIRPVIYNRPYKGLGFLAEGLKALSGRDTYGKAVITITEPAKFSKL